MNRIKIKTGVSRTIITFRNHPCIKINQTFDKYPTAVDLSLSYLNTFLL